MWSTERIAANLSAPPLLLVARAQGTYGLSAPEMTKQIAWKGTDDRLADATHDLKRSRAEAGGSNGRVSDREHLIAHSAKLEIPASQVGSEAIRINSLF
jgi:hypothetical protein